LDLNAAIDQATVGLNQGEYYSERFKPAATETTGDEGERLDTPHTP
jgi:hypothetical protein